MELYGVILEKKSDLCGGCFDETPSDGTLSKPWITLGHFDAMYLRKLEWRDRDLFRTIADSGSDLARWSGHGRHFHQLFLLSEQDQSPFWGQDSNFFAVSRLHFADSFNVKNAYQNVEEALAKYQKNLGAEVSYLVCRTVELSDAVLAVRSEKLQDLLQFTLSLRSILWIGKVYTYCGINYERIKNNSLAVREEDTLDFLSMRFSVSQFSEVQGALQKIMLSLPTPIKEPYSIVGVDDIICVWNKLPVRQLVELYRRWFVEGKIPSHAFIDVTSRAGTSFQRVADMEKIPEPYREPDSISQLKLACKRMNTNLYTRCGIGPKAKVDEALETSLKAVQRLTDSLVHMSETPILDEFIYMMYPGVQAFLSRFSAAVKKNYQADENFFRLDENTLTFSNRFIDSWASLMENIIRIEGQLTQQPEVRPVLYDIPVAMLEYILAFLVKVKNIFLQGDQNLDIAFFLVPKLCEQIEAWEIFPRGPAATGLVMITLPIGSLYTPVEIQYVLSHEAAHFVGETFRCREQRFRFFSESAAHLFSKTMYRNPYSHIAEKAKEYFNRFSGERYIKRQYEWIMEVVLDALYAAEDENAPAERRDIAKNLYLQYPDILDYCWDMLDDFSRSLKDVGVLFREVYADLCMLYLLDMPGDKYVSSIIHKLDQDEAQSFSEQYSIRMFASLKAAQKEVPFQTVQTLSEPLYKNILRIQAALSTGEDRDLRIPVAAIRPLMEYAQCCYRTLLQHIPQGNGQLEEIRTMFQNTNPVSGSYSTLLNSIEQYRKDLDLPLQE